MTGAATAFVDALCAKDTDALVALFVPDLQFRALTPGRFWEAATADEAIAKVLWVWFSPDETIEAVDGVEVGDAFGRGRVDYRLLVRNAKGNRYSVEQRAYLDYANDGRISRIELLCAGFRRVDA